MMRFLTGVFVAILCAASASAQDITFDEWRDDFRPRLIAAGADPDTAAAMLDDLEPDERVVSRDRSQPEFVRPIWDYLASAVSQTRIANGQAAYGRVRATADAVADEYGLPAEILIAIWGLESAYGEITGDNDIVRAYATLAWEGRRRAWAEGELIAVARMIDNGYATRDQLTGSWAGAMGQMQFIPSTYLERAVDWDGDGRRNIWTHEGDALASAANLLSRAGWAEGAPAAVEIALPDDFDLFTWTPSQNRLVSEWAVRGLRPASGREWRADELMRSARLILPAGADGPGFLIYPNFRVIMRYNNSTAYALAVAHLADRIAGGAAWVGGWPENNPPITRSQTEELQTALNALGHDAGTPDGIAGPNTRRALRAFQRAQGHAPDGYVGRAMYDAVVAARAAAQAAD